MSTAILQFIVTPVCVYHVPGAMKLQKLVLESKERIGMLANAILEAVIYSNFLNDVERK